MPCLLTKAATSGLSVPLASCVLIISSATNCASAALMLKPRAVNAASSPLRTVVLPVSTIPAFSLTHASETLWGVKPSSTKFFLNLVPYLGSSTPAILSIMSSTKLSDLPITLSSNSFLAASSSASV